MLALSEDQTKKFVFACFKKSLLTVVVTIHFYCTGKGSVHIMLKITFLCSMDKYYLIQVSIQARKIWKGLFCLVTHMLSCITS